MRPSPVLGSTNEVREVNLVLDPALLRAWNAECANRSGGNDSCCSALGGAM
jgi:hypothetical protein